MKITVMKDGVPVVPQKLVTDEKPPADFVILHGGSVVPDGDATFVPENEGSKNAGSYREFMEKYGDRIRQSTGKEVPTRSPFRDHLSKAAQFAASIAGDSLLKEARKQRVGHA